MILCLGPKSPLFAWLSANYSTTLVESPIDLQPNNEFDAIVSYGYRHKVKEPILACVPLAINIHISLLPYNRGAHPVLWSQFEGTPNGATIHHMDAGIDTGDIIAQIQVNPTNNDTLKTLYDATHKAAQVLFYETWPAILSGTATRRRQAGDWTAHRHKDGEALISRFPLRWDTPCSAIADAGEDIAISRDFWDQYRAEIAGLRS